MQFKLITAVLASAAVSGVAAGPIEARQDGKTPSVTDTSAVAVKPEENSGGVGTIPGLSDNLQFDPSSFLATSGSGTTPPVAADPAIDPAAFKVPGLDHVSFGDITFNQPAKQADCPAWQPGCPGYYPGYYPSGPVYPPVYPNPTNPTYTFCVTYGFPPGYGCEIYSRPAPAPPAPSPCPNPFQLKCNNYYQCGNPQWYPSYYKNYCQALSVYGQPICECTY